MLADLALSSHVRSDSEKRCGAHPSHRSVETVRKGSCRTSPSFTKRVGLLQSLLPRSEKGWRPQAHPRPQTPEQSANDTPVQDADNQTNPCANSPRGLFFLSGSERCLFSHPNIAPSQAIPEICLRGAGLPVHSTTVRPITGTSYIYEVHGRSTLPPETAGSASVKLPRRLADYSPIRGTVDNSQILAPQPFTMPGSKDQCFQEHTVSQPGYFFLGYSDRLYTNENAPYVRARAHHSTPSGIPQSRRLRSSQEISEDVGSHGLSIISTPAWTTAHASSPALRVLKTITEARAPSTRRLYAKKWVVFSGWCAARSLDPYSCEVLSVLAFLQELLDAGHIPSTLKVYVAAITASHAPVAGQSL